MTNRHYLFLILLLVISLNSYCLLRWIDVPARNRVQLELKTGDIVLRKGKGLISGWFASMSQRDPWFSHAGVAVLFNDTVRIVSCTQDHIPSGMISELPGEFLNGAMVESYSVYRPALSEVQQQLLVTEIQKDLLHPFPFDDHYELDDRKSYYCTEYIYQLFHRIAPRVNITTSSLGEWTYIAPDDLYINAGMQQIYSTRTQQ